MLAIELIKKERKKKNFKRERESEKKKEQELIESKSFYCSLYFFILF